MQLKSIGKLSLAEEMIGKASDINDVTNAVKTLTLSETAELLVKKKINEADAVSILEKTGVSKASAKQALESAKVTAAETAETGATVGLSNALKGLWVSIAPILANPLTWIAVGLGALIKVGHETSQAIEEIREKAQALGSEFNETKTNIDGYKEQIESLYETINDSKSSVQQVTEARQTLMTVQDELIDKFGSEKETIDIVTEAINGQADALDKLTNKKWQETINEFNKNDFWGNFANWREGYSDNMDRMIHEMENAGQIGLRFTSTDYYGGKYDNVIKELEKRGFTYDVGTASFFKDDGTLRNLYDEILDIQEALKDEAPDYFNKILEEDATEAKEKLDQYGDMWDTYILNDRILANEKLANSFKDINDAYSEYEKAKTSGDKDVTDAAVGNFSKKLNEAIANAGDEKGTVEYFKNMYPTLAREAEKWEFKTNIIPEFDTSKLKGKTQNDILKMLQTAGNQEGEDIFSSILENATDAEIVTGEYSQRVETLLGLLTEWGILQADIAESANDTSNSLSINELSNQITTFKTAQESLTTALSEQSSTGTISNDTLAALKENYEGIENAIEFTTDGIILNTSKLRDLNAEQRKNTADELAKKEEDLTKQYQEATLKLAEYDRLSKEHSDENDNLKSVYDDLVNSQQNEVNALDDEITGLKALQKEYNNSISTHNAFMEALSSPNEGAGYESIVSSLEKVQQQWDKGLYGTDDIRTFVDYMTSADMSNASVDEIMNQYEKAMETAKQFFTENKDGSRKFLELLQETSIEVDGVTQSLATYDEASNKWNIDIQDMAKASEATGYSTDFLIDNLNRLKDFGFNVIFGETDDFTNYKQAIDDVNKEIADTQIALEKTSGKSQELKQKLKDLNDVKVNLEDNIPTSAVDEAIEKIQQLQTEIQTLQTIPGITSADIDKKRQQQADIAQTAGIELTAVIGGDTEKAEVAAENLKKAIEDSTATMLVDANVKPAQDAIDAVANATYTANLKLRLSTVNATDVNNVINKIKENASGGGATAYGTANIGKSFAGGSIGTNKTLHNVMVSEVQPEMVVDPSSGQYTIYKYPTMLDTLPKNSIVFNGKQTSEILKNGMTTSYGKALASGTLTGVSFAKTTAETSGSGNLLNDNSSTSKSNTGNDKTKGKNNNNNKDKKSKNLIDWIERRINVLTTKAERWANIIEKATDPERIDSYYKKFNSITQKQIKTYGDAYNRYMSKANSVGLSKDLINKVQSKDSSLFDKNGNLKSYKKLIKEYGEKNAQKIQNYEQWYDKAISAIDNFTESVYKLANSPLEKAADKTELLSKSLDELTATIDNISIDDYKKANNNLKQQTKNAELQRDASKEALESTTAAFNSSKNAVLNKKNLQKNDIAGKNDKERKANIKAIKDAQAAGKELDLSMYKLGSSGYKAAVKYNAALKANTDATHEALIAEETYIKTVRENYKQQFDNIEEYYDKQVELKQVEEDRINRTAGLSEAKGMTVDRKLYREQIEYEKEKRSLYEKSKAELQEQLALIPVGTAEWYDAKKALANVDASIDECTKSTVEFGNKITDITNALHKMVQNELSAITDTMNTLAQTWDKFDKFDEDTGAFTREGRATMGTYVTAMNVAVAKLQKDSYVLKQLQEAIDTLPDKWEDTNGIEVAGRKYYSKEQIVKDASDIESEANSAIVELMNAENNAIDMMIEKYEAEAKSLKKIVDLKKQSLSAEKDLYNYQKQIKDANKSIGDIQKQLAASMGDTSEAGRMKTQRLQKQLTEANESRDDLERDRYFSDMESMLDKVYDEYYEKLQKEMKDRNKLLQRFIESSNAHLGEIAQTIQEYSYKYNYTDVLGHLEQGIDALKMDTSFIENGQIKTIANLPTDLLTSVENKLDSIVAAIESSDKTVQNNNTETSNGDDHSSSMSYGMEGPPVDTSPQPQNTNAKTNVIPITTGTPKLDNSTQLSSTLNNGISATLNNSSPNLSQGASIATVTGDTAVTEAKLKAKKQLENVETIFGNSSYYGKGSKGKASDYKTEINKHLFTWDNGNILYDGKDGKHGNGLKAMREALNVSTNDEIISAIHRLKTILGVSDIKNTAAFSGGGIGKLIPKDEDGIAFVRNGEGFVSPEDVPHIQELLNIVPQVNNILKPMSLPNYSSNIGKLSPIEATYNFTLENCNNAQDIIRSIQTDRNVQQALQEVTINQLNGSSSRLSINKY